MNHTRVSLRVHVIFATKEHQPNIPPELQERLWAVIGGIARQCGMTAIAVGGTADHAHVLLLLPPTIPLATAVQKLKANSSRWLHQQTRHAFEWQEGYAAYSVSISHTEQVVAYILNQREHHRHRPFSEELAKLLARL